MRDAGVQVNFYMGSDLMVDALRNEYRMLGYNPNRVVPNADVAGQVPGAVAVQRPNRLVLESTYEAWRGMAITLEVRDFSDYREPGWQARVVFWDNRPISRIPDGQRMAFVDDFIRALPRVRLPLQIIRDGERADSETSED